MSNEINIIALKKFRSDIKKMFSSKDLNELIDFLSQFPEKGDVIPGTGGLRKLRWALADKGKRGGSRVIYYYHKSEYEILLLRAYAKNDIEDITSKEKKILTEVVKEFIK